MDEKISVIIPTKNRKHDLITCLKSISIQALSPHEIIIVDSSDTDMLKSELHVFNNLNIKYIHSSICSIPVQKNIGLKTSLGNIVVFSDDDMIWDEDYLKNIMHVFNNDQTKKIGGVTGNVLPPKYTVGKIKTVNRITYFGMHIIKLVFFLPRYGNGRFQFSGMPTIIQNNSHLTTCEFLYGGSMAFRKEVINEFMFDENLGGYAWGEDDDIAYRISRKYQNIYTPFAKIIHNDKSSSHSGNIYSSRKMLMENNYYLFKKNLPQDFIHTFAFWWSVLGLFVVGAMESLRRKESSGVKGLVCGFVNVIKRKGIINGE